VNLETAKELAELEDNSVQLESSMEILRAKRAALRSGRAVVRDTVRENEGVDEDDPLINMDDGVRLEPFNMRREMAEGHFDESGFYVLNKDEEKEVTDAWLDTVDQAEKTASFLQEKRFEKAKQLAASRLSALKKNLGKDADEEEDEDAEEKENEWTVEIDKSVGGRLGIGLDVKHNEELGDRIYIEDIDDDGLFAKWNEANPTKTVQVGDRILQVNGESSTEEVTSGLGKHPVLKIKFIREEKEDAPEEEKDTATMIEALIAELRPLESPVEALARWARGSGGKGGAAASRGPAGKGLEPLKMRSRKRQQRAQAAVAAPNGTGATGSKAAVADSAAAAANTAGDAGNKEDKSAESAPSKPKRLRLDEFGNYQEYVKDANSGSAPTSIMAEATSSAATGSTAGAADVAMPAAEGESASAVASAATATAPKTDAEAGSVGGGAGGTTNGDSTKTEAQPGALVPSTETSGVADAAAVAAAAERVAAADKAAAEAAKAAAAEARVNRHTVYMDVNLKGPEQAAMEAVHKEAEKKEEKEEPPPSVVPGQRKRSAEPGILEQARRKKIERLTDLCDRLLERGVLVYDSTREQLAIEVRQRRGEFDKEEGPEEATATSSDQSEKKDAQGAPATGAADAGGAAADAPASGSTKAEGTPAAAAPADGGAAAKAEQKVMFVNSRCQPWSSTNSTNSEESGLLKLLAAQPDAAPDDPEAGQALPNNGHTLRWQIRWTASPEQSHGPFDSVTMQGWVAQGCFSEERPAEVRQCNEANEPTEQCWHHWDEVDFSLYW